jgi:hypothetical protein
MEAMSSRRFKLWAAGIACGVIALAGSVALSPAFAGKTYVREAPCNSANPCLTLTNHGSGVALKGSAGANTALIGQTTVNNKSVGFAGVFGADLATPNPSGTPFNNAGVLGQTATGAGVLGQATSGIGVRGIADTGNGMSSSANGGDGIFATTQSNLSGLSSAGVFGEDVGNSSLAAGVEGFSGTGIAVQGDQFERGRFLNAAFLGLTFANSINTFFPAQPPGGLFNSDIGEGVVAEAQGSAEALAAANFGGGPLIRAYQAHTEMMELDNAGNMILKGKLTQHGNPHAVVHTAGAGDVVMYSPAQAVASVEDVGEAQLIHGQAYVALDPRFASTMDRTRSYLVFITPQGDSAGLYVTQKSSTGFSVREHGGQSNITFDYRIVAQPLEYQGSRLAPAPTLSAHGFTSSFTRRKADLIADKGLVRTH